MEVISGMFWVMVGLAVAALVLLTAFFVVKTIAKGAYDALKYHSRSCRNFAIFIFVQVVFWGGCLLACADVPHAGWYFLMGIVVAIAVSIYSVVLEVGHHRVIREDEILVDIPDGFRSGTQEGFVGEFTVRQNGSPYTWRRSFARNMPLPSRATFPAELVHRQTYTSPALRKVAAAALQFPPMTDKDREFFAPYEKQMHAHLNCGDK